MMVRIPANKYAFQLSAKSFPQRLYLPTVSSFGIPLPPAEQSAGRAIVAMSFPCQITCTPVGNSIRASKATLDHISTQSQYRVEKNSRPALSNDPVRATVNPLSVTLVTIPWVKVKLEVIK